MQSVFMSGMSPISLLTPDVFCLFVQQCCAFVVHLFEIFHHVTLYRASVLHQHGVTILNEVVGTETALDKVLFAVGTFHIANIFVRVGDFAWDPVRDPQTIDTIELFR